MKKPYYNEDIGKLLLRLFAGAILLLHGSFKVFNDNSFVQEKVVEAGLPAFVSYGVYLGEFIAPLLIILGFKARLGGLVMSISMLMSIILAHAPDAFRLNDYGGWIIEFNALLMICGLVIFFLGSGKYSLSKGLGNWD